MIINKIIFKREIIIEINKSKWFIPPYSTCRIWWRPRDGIENKYVTRGITITFCFYSFRIIINNLYPATSKQLISFDFY